MANFAFTCTCGHVMTLEAPNRDEAVRMFKSNLTQEALDEHIRTHQPNEPRPTLEQAHASIDQTVRAV